MSNVFTYGSLMYDQVWKAVVGSVHRSEEAILEGYVRSRIRFDVYPVIYPDLGRVTGILYRDVLRLQLRRLDRFEGKYYNRERVTVRCASGSEAPAFAYVLKQEFHALIGEEWDQDHFERVGIRKFLDHYKGFGETGE